MSATFGPFGVFGLMGSKASFNPSTDIGDLSGKVIVITGATKGMGQEICKAVVEHKPSKVILLARTYRMALSLIRQLNAIAPNVPIVSVECNLASLKSVKEAAQKVEEETDRIDILFNNAGVLCTERGLSKDGYENQFATNFVSHALLTRLLLPTLERTTQDPHADVRIVFTSSMAHIWCPKDGISFGELKTVQPSVGTWARHGQSKLASILFASELAQRYPKITTVAVHPGIVNTSHPYSLERRSMFLSTMHSIISPFSGLIGVTEPEVGAWNMLWAATAPKSKVDSGKFYTPVGVPDQGSALSNDSHLAARLWEWTEDELKSYEA